VFCRARGASQGGSVYGRSILKVPYTTTVTATNSGQDLIHRLDLRVGKIVQVDLHPQADHLYVEQVNLGEQAEESALHERTIVSGLVKYINSKDMLNKQVVVVANMKPSKFRGVLSQGMLLAASKGDKVELLEPAAGSIVGERVQIDTMQELGQPDEILKPKQRVMELVAADLCTDNSCIATWKNLALKTSAGLVRCKSIENGTIS
ncbi:hypothetical protein INT43_008117, partial [Umbelopsis isabellina]